MKHETTDKRLLNVTIKYGKTNIEDKKFVLMILGLLQECNSSLSNKKRRENSKLGE